MPGLNDPNNRLKLERFRLFVTYHCRAGAARKNLLLHEALALGRALLRGGAFEVRIHLQEPQAGLALVRVVNNLDNVPRVFFDCIARDGESFRPLGEFATPASLDAFCPRIHPFFIKHLKHTRQGGC